MNPPKSLITADAGFVGYEHWSAVSNSGREFIIRVGSNVKLLKNLGCARSTADTVYLWPDKAAKNQQPPLALRRVVVDNGKHPCYLVTSISAAELTSRQFANIYRLRWGIEAYYRHSKQTYERRKLRSYKADHAAVEVHCRWLDYGPCCFM